MGDLTWALVAYGSISAMVMAAVLVGAVVRFWRER
jgi:hypothetical protein